MKKVNLDLVIVGGGVMGLFTAYSASLAGARNILVIEKYKIGNSRRSSNDPKAASFSFTRSIRNDYLDPFYSRLAYESRKLWLEFEGESREKFLINSGCLNIARKDVTPNLEKSYAIQSFRSLNSINFKTKRMSKSVLKLQYPQFDADLGCLDVEAGFLYLPQITKTLLQVLNKNRVQILEETKILTIKQIKGDIEINTNVGKLKSKKLVITAGLWSNEVLKLIQGCNIQFPVKPDKPQQCRYYIPPLYKRDSFVQVRLPVFAYLDVGIYGHPIFEGKTPGVKIGFYNPPDIPKKDTKIKNISDFVRICMPSLLDAKVREVVDADQCFYDMVSDKQFIIGKLPGFPNISVGCGWNGTGYKFAPIVGKILAQISLQNDTLFDIRRFSPGRFSVK